MKLIRDLFRYKLTALFFIIGQLIMFVTVFGALNIINKAYYKEIDRLKAQYEYRVDITISKMSKMDLFDNISNGVDKGNLIVSGKYNLYVSELEHSYITEVILIQNEDIPYDIVSGRLPGSDSNDKGKKLVAVGRDKYNKAVEKNGKKYLTIENEEYEIIGVIGNKHSDYLDYKMVMDYNCMGDNAKKILIEQNNYTLKLGSNLNELSETYKQIYMNLMKKSTSLIIEGKQITGKGENIINGTLVKENIKINIIVYLFCVLNGMLISEFWILERKKEFVIKRIFGYNKKKIILEILKNVVLLSLTAMLIFTGVYIIASIIGINIYAIELNLRSIVIFIIIDLLSIITTMVYPIYKIIKMPPRMSLQEIG